MNDRQTELKEYSAHIFEMGCMEQRVYLKSEADKVIADLKNEIEIQKRLRDMALASVPNVLKVMKIIQHHKYKRCLAMAKWCDTKGDWYYSLGESFRNRVDFYIRWRDRWLKIAEKFKEASDEKI